MIELNKIYNEDCLQTMSRMPDNFVDLTVTSPPYDNLRDYKGYDFDFENTAKELFRVTKKGGVVVWVVGDATINGSETGTSFRQALYFMKCGFNLHDTMIYAKLNYVPLNHNRYEQEFEYSFILSKGTPKTFNPILKTNSGKGKKRTSKYRHHGEYLENQHTDGIINQDSRHGNVFYYSIGSNRSSKDNIAFEHPAIYPEKLAQDHIKSWSMVEDLIYDPFMGSGTTLKMAHLLKRNWIGSEISKEYCELANKRIKPYLDQKTLF